jgi:predicted Fe-Mo cluster-binding NifX family protein
MKIAVSAIGDNLDAQLDPRFGRCLYFIFVDTESMEFDAMPLMPWVVPESRRHKT